VEIIREILASHESGISRGGLLAWARLRGDPDMTDAQLEEALAGLGDEVVDVQGFLYLRRFAPESALATEASARPLPPPAGAPANPPTWPSATSTPETGAVPGWAPPDGDAAAPGWASPDAGAATSPPPPAEGWPTPDGGWPATPPSSSTRTMVVAALGVVAFLVVAGIGAALLRGADSGSPDATPALPTPSSGAVVGATALALGDCLILPSEDEFDDVRALPCTDPHDGEVIFTAAHPGSVYPSDEEFNTYVEDQCVPAFEAYSGSAYDDQDVLDIGWFTPTEAGWDDGTRTVTCYLTPLDGSRTSQSYRGANP
jgi:hypothetical protein